MKRSFGFIAAAAAASAVAFALAGAHADESPGPVTLVGADTTPVTYMASLGSLRGANAPADAGGDEGREREIRRGLPAPINRAQVSDGALQSDAPAAAPTVTGRSFDGVGVGLAGFSPDSAPPDTTGAVGATQYVQWVNTDLAVFDKATGALLLGPVPGNTLFQSLGGACATSNDGDPVVQYDKAAQRWVLSQFAVPGGTGGYWQCVAVSQTSDATGGWYLYAFQYSQFPDYPKMGVWSDGYYITFNMFTSSFAGARLCVYDRAKMLAGQAATQQCFQLSNSIASVLPADVDGNTAPPGGSPNYMVTRGGTSALSLYKFHTDWANAAASTLTGPFKMTVASYSMACRGGTCVAQPNTGQRLDSLADRLMFRLAYRNIGGSERMVVNHSVTAHRTSGVRWYEIRGMAGTPGVYQQGTYSPDSTYRWMGSAAMDKQGNMAVRYSYSSSSKFPGLAYATRLAGDPLGTLGTETTIQAGHGSQVGNLDRWGDYTHMSVDPTDDCTFWYVGQYLKSTGSFNWSTRITSFKLAACS